MGILSDDLAGELTAGWRREDLLLADVCAGRPTSVGAPDLDWDYVLKAAEYHRVIPLLRHAAAPGTKIHRAIEEKTHGAVQRNLVLTGELSRLSARLASHEIDMIGMKGAELAIRGYGSVGRRTFGDIDVLVPRGAIARVAELLGEDGYDLLRESDVDKLTKTQLGIEFIHPDGFRVVEVHWNLLNRIMKYDPDIAGIWERRVSVDIGGQPVAVMSVEDEILFLCAHGTKHCWEHLQQITDVAGIIERHSTSIDWDWIIATAGEQSATRMLNVATILLVGLTDVDVPAQLVASAEGDPGALKLARRAAGWIAYGRSQRTPVDTARFHMLARERLVDRIPYALHVARLAFLPSDRDRAFVKLPTWLSGLYVIVRPIRVVAERLRSIE